MAQPTRAIDALMGSINSQLAPGDGMALPVAVLWTDGDGQWAELVARLAGEVPNLFTLGAYDPARRTGPAIWLRCVVERTLPDVWPASAKPPILYLARVERQQLRAGADCPPALQPLVELQFRGTVWHQRNGRDWTVEAFLTSSDGCDLDMAKDQQTKSAMLRVLPQLADVPLDSIRGRRLTADDFDRLAVPDLQRDVLVWMHDPKTFASGRTPSEWSAFRNLVKNALGMDPEDDGPIEAASRLIEGAGQWATIWQRFCNAPHRYRGVSTLLREPLKQGILLDGSRLPALNDDEEGALRTALQGIASMPHAAACARIAELEAAHGIRRSWVWHALGESPLADAMQPLSVLASCALKGLAGATTQELAIAYAADGWPCDEAALAALARPLSSSQHALIGEVVRALYLPWLERVSREFQDAVARAGGMLPTESTAPLEPGTCLLFVDGLRYDVAVRLQAALSDAGVTGSLRHRLGPIPTVTATAKPLATVVSDEIEGDGGENFTPRFKDTRQPVTAGRLRDRVAARGIDLLDLGAIAMPLSEDSTGWAELGRLDELGHTLQDGLAEQLEREIQTLRDGVLAILGAGWRRVRVVTDHGWLLIPGGLPKIQLPLHLVESRWARCATVRAGATPDVATSPWYWNAQVRIATPSGVGAYAVGTCYAHGGVSPQECVVPELTLERGVVAASARIASVEWKRLRCVVTVTANDPKLQVDVRSNWRIADTSLVVAPKPIGEGGTVSLAVRDEKEGQAAMVVVLDAEGRVLDKRSTTVGGD